MNRQDFLDVQNVIADMLFTVADFQRLLVTLSDIKFSDARATRVESFVKLIEETSQSFEHDMQESVITLSRFHVPTDPTNLIPTRIHRKKGGE